MLVTEPLVREMEWARPEKGQTNACLCRSWCGCRQINEYTGTIINCKYVGMLPPSVPDNKGDVVVVVLSHDLR